MPIILIIILLCITEHVILQDDYQQKQAQHKESVKQKAKELKNQRKFLREIGKECSKQPQHQQPQSQHQLKPQPPKKAFKKKRPVKNKSRSDVYASGRDDSHSACTPSPAPCYERARSAKKSHRPISAHHSRRPSTMMSLNKRIAFEMENKDEIEMPSELSEFSLLGSSDSSTFSKAEAKETTSNSSSSGSLALSRNLSPLDVISVTKRQSSIIGHVDSLLLIPKLSSEGVEIPKVEKSVMRN